MIGTAVVLLDQDVQNAGRVKERRCEAVHAEHGAT
jgi:hypothetical protein